MKKDNGDPSSKRLELWTGAFLLKNPSKKNRHYGTVFSRSGLEAPGQIELHLRKLDIEFSDEDDLLHLILTEAQGEELIKNLQRTLENITHLRALHHLGLLNEKAYLTTNEVETKGSSEEKK